MRVGAQLFWIVLLSPMSLQCGYPASASDEETSNTKGDEEERPSSVENAGREEESESRYGYDAAQTRDYPVDCLGDICNGTCCDGALCADSIYTDEREYVENYCYPACDDKYGETGCERDDVCVIMDEEETVKLCLGSGTIEAEPLSLKMMDVGMVPGSDDIIDIPPDQVTAVLAGQEIAFSRAYGWFLEGDLFEQGEGFEARWAAVAMYAKRDQNSAWVLEIYLSESYLDEGIPHASPGDVETETAPDQLSDAGVPGDAGVGGTALGTTPRGQVSWFAQLLSFVDIDQGGRPARVFLEGELSDSERNGIDIQKVGAPCSEQNGECYRYEIGFNLEFFAIRSEILFE